MNTVRKKIGIWGFGIVGKSATSYLQSQGHELEVLDAKELSSADQDFLTGRSITWLLQKNDLTHFLEKQDAILASPGIDLRPYAAYAHKWITELDIFGSTFKKPIIAITGSVGKTSITTLLSHILSKNDALSLYTGGNIGYGMLDMLNNKDNYDAALLEVSSFQLEQCHSFAPTLGIWTNFYPNHLDRHGTLENYFNAKFNLLAHLNKHQHALVPLALAEHFKTKNIAGTLHFFSTTRPSDEAFSSLAPTSTLFFADQNRLYHYHNQILTPIVDLAVLPTITFMENWIIIGSALHILQHNVDFPDFLTKLVEYTADAHVPEHRLELVATIKGVHLYNDSKATTPASTLAALEQLQNNPIHIIIGGLSKGIDRKPFIQSLKGRVVHVYCFGKEAETLAKWCHEYSIKASLVTSLHDALTAALQTTQQPDIILFSPAGSSFDLFLDYQERGRVFKQLVKNYHDSL